MTWRPTHLTREQMEERRLQGTQLLKAGKLSQAEIARQLGVSRAAVTNWAQQLEASEPLQRRVAPGRPPKLTRAQQQTLKRLLKRGARAAGFPTEQRSVLIGVKSLLRALPPVLETQRNGNQIAARAWRWRAHTSGVNGLAFG